jgi:predicted nucleic acid-binding protein
MANRVLLDADIPIDYLRGRIEAADYLENLTISAMISAATVAELYAGVRDGLERSKLDAFIAAFEVMPIDAEIALQGGLYRRDYGKSHSTGLVDGLIAATAERHDATLITLNKKHFPMLQSVVVPYQKV